MVWDASRHTGNLEHKNQDISDRRTEGKPVLVHVESKAPVISGGDNLRARNESQSIRGENQNEGDVHPRAKIITWREKEKLLQLILN